jgi:phospholipid/cholesterol/gamma-HCH transport system ATP-binding protein
MATNEMIKVDGLVGGYPDNLILDGVSFEVRQGEIFVILGASGCGKSTLMKHLIGLIEPFEGRITVDGDDIQHADENQFKRFLRKIGVLFQAGGLLGSMTVAENIALPLTEFTTLPPRLIDSMVEMKLNLVNLEGFGNRLPAELSGGMKKRAGLARAMALNPKILFFDEPSAGLDPITSAELDNLILHLNRSLGTTMVIVTHELQSIFAIAHRVVMLDSKTKGIIAEGDPRDLRDHSRNETVRKFFNRLPGGSVLPEGIE